MSRLLSDLEAVLRALIDEHRKLLRHVDAHQAAMRAWDLRAMDDLAAAQESSRVRIASWEARRRATVAQIVKTMRPDPSNGKPQSLTLAELAHLHPQRRAALLKLRDELKEVVQAVTGRARINGRIAGAVLGHLNTAVRLLAGVMEKAGLYTKDGTPRVAKRIGVMEAVA